jgi:GNAT superfamily N-acetyltransferase
MTEHLEEHHAVTVNDVLCAMHFKQGPTLDAQNFRILEMVRQLVINFGAEVTFLQVTGNAESGESGSAAGTEAGSQLWMAQARDLLGSSKKLLILAGAPSLRLNSAGLPILKKDLSNLHVDEKYSGRGIGIAAIRRAIDLFAVNYRYVVIVPKPQQLNGQDNPDQKEVKKAETKLRGYYRRIGFKNRKKTEFMFLNMAYRRKDVLLRMGPLRELLKRIWRISGQLLL